jgi:hypothetical protein
MPEQIIPGGIVKPDSLTKPPTIIFLINATLFNSSDISLPIQIKVGDSISADFKRIDVIYYKGDWQNNNTELYRYLPQFMNGSRPRMSSLQEFSTIINLTEIPEGNHTLTVKAGEIGGYIRNKDNLCYAYSFIINQTSTFNFFIETDTTPSSTPTLPSEDRNAPYLDPTYYLIPASVVVAVVIVLSVLLLRRHRKTAK